MSSSSNNLVTLKTSDGTTFVVEEAAKVQFCTIQNVLESGFRDSVIPLSKIKGGTLIRILEWGKRHANVDQNRSAPTEEELEKWDATFIKKLDQNSLIPMMTAANYLACDKLLDLLASRIAHTIKDMMVEQVRKVFHIEGDFMADEEKDIHRNNEWAYEIP